KPIEAHLIKHPRGRRFVRASDVFPERGALLRSDFYRKYMAPQKRFYAIGLFFWQRQRLLAIIVIMRTAKQGDFTPVQTKLLRHLYPQFETALRRLHVLERERAARTALEGFLRRPATPLRHLVRLTQREQQLSRLVCDGHSNQEIADKSGLSVAMVKKHLHSIFHELEVPSRSRLIALMR